MAKPNYELTADAVLRNGVKVATIEKDGAITVVKEQKKYRLQVHKFVKSFVHSATKPAPRPPVEKSFLDIKNETMDQEPMNPIMMKKRAKHNPFGLKPLEDIPPCPEGGKEGTKSPEVVKWFKTYYPEEAELYYEDWENKKKFYLKKEELKQERLRQAKEGRR